MKYKVKFRISGDNHKRSKFSLNLEEGKKLSVGSGTSFLRLNNPSVSKVHCYIFIRSGRTLLQDNDGRGGTRLNNQLVDEAHIKPGDIIQMGDYSIEMLLCPFEESEETQTGSPATQFIDIDDLNALKEEIAKARGEEKDKAKVTGAAAIRPVQKKQIEEEDISKPLEMDTPSSLNAGKSDEIPDSTALDMAVPGADPYDLGFDITDTEAGTAVPRPVDSDVETKIEDIAEAPSEASSDSDSGIRRPIMGTHQIEKIQERERNKTKTRLKTKTKSKSKSKRKVRGKTKTDIVKENMKDKPKVEISQKDVPAVARIRLPGSVTTDFEAESDTERHPVLTRSQMVKEAKIAEVGRSLTGFTSTAQKIGVTDKTRTSLLRMGGFVHYIVSAVVMSLAAMGNFNILGASEDSGFGAYLLAALASIVLLLAVSAALRQFQEFVEASGSLRDYFRFFSYVSLASIPISYVYKLSPMTGTFVALAGFGAVIWWFISKFGPLPERFLVLVGGFVATLALVAMVYKGGGMSWDPDWNRRSPAQVPGSATGTIVVKPISNAVLAARGSSDVDLNVMRLFVATVTGDIGTVKALIENRSISVDRAFVSGHTAIMAAAENRQSNILEYLLIKGAEIDKTDPNGYTALMHAIESEDEVAVEMLLKYGASVFPRSSRNEAAADIAKRRQARKIEFMVRNPDKFRSPAVQRRSERSADKPDVAAEGETQESEELADEESSDESATSNQFGEEETSQEDAQTGTGLKQGGSGSGGRTTSTAKTPAKKLTAPATSTRSNFKPKRTDAVKRQKGVTRRATQPTPPRKTATTRTLPMPRAQAKPMSQGQVQPKAPARRSVQSQEPRKKLPDRLPAKTLTEKRQDRRRELEEQRQKRIRESQDGLPDEWGDTPARKTQPQQQQQSPSGSKKSIDI